MKWGAILMICSEGDFPQAINLDKLEKVVEWIESTDSMSEKEAEDLRHEVLDCIDYDRGARGSVFYEFDNEGFAFTGERNLRNLARAYRSLND